MILIFVVLIPLVYFYYIMGRKKNVDILIDKLPGLPRYPIIGTAYAVIGVKREG